MIVNFRSLKWSWRGAAENGTGASIHPQGMWFCRAWKAADPLPITKLTGHSSCCCCPRRIDRSDGRPLRNKRIRQKRSWPRRGRRLQAGTGSYLTCAYHHPRPWVGTFISPFSSIAPERGLFASACVSAGGLCLAEGRICAFVSASKIPVPRSSGDRFGDWVVSASVRA